jgi:hypothetical protein
MGDDKLHRPAVKHTVATSGQFNSGTLRYADDGKFATQQDSPGRIALFAFSHRAGIAAGDK